MNQLAFFTLAVCLVVLGATCLPSPGCTHSDEYSAAEIQHAHEVLDSEEYAEPMLY